jgi:Tfp pilus assembly protein PilF
MDAADSPETVSFHRDVAPVLYARCASCHRPQGAAPFSLLAYEDARSRSGQIAEVTSSRFMPPWLPEAGHESLHGERRLTDHEIRILADWAEADAPEGDPNDAPPMPKFAAGWQLGEPDLVLESPTFELSADGPDRFRNFVIAVPPGVDHRVQAVELQPEKPKVTHHVRLGIDANNESTRRDAADAEVGYEGMAWGADPEGQLITWTPGMTPDAGTSGAAWRLTSDVKLVLHTHLQPSGKREPVRFRIGLHFADNPPTLQPMILRVGSRDIDIPAAAASHVVTDEYELPIDVDAHFVFPHAHSLCREMLVQAILPDGGEKTLLAIRDFDENWHDTYRFAKPVRLPRGTRLVTQFTYDNSTANPRNPNHPPDRVVYGSNADDEMCDVYLQVTPVDPAQLAVLAEHQHQAELKSKIVGYRKTLEVHSQDPWSIEGLASCYVADRRPAEAVQLLEATPQLLDDSVQANVVLGLAQLATGDLGAAEQRLRTALAMDEEFALAWLGLGQTLAAKSQTDEAEQAFRRAVALAPRLTGARLDLADLLVAQEQLPEAATVCEDAIRQSPADYKPELKLANIRAQQQDYDAALKHFEAAQKLAPFVYSPRASLAIACYQSGDESTANRLLREALADDQNDPVAYCFLGQIARRNGEAPEARQLLRKASELPTPTTWPASHRRQFLALVYAEQLQLANDLHDEALARQVLEAWRRLEPQNAAISNMLRQLNGD